MMSSTIQVLVVLLAVVAAVAVIANRLKVPPSILLVLTGVVIALVPGLPPVELAPELVLLLILPPVIYNSAFLMSWREFQFNLRPITLLAVGGVAFTTLAVAAAAHWVMDIAWPVGFLLGAIVSPPDAIAPLDIARRMELPRRLLVILEGEALANDATALIPLSRAARFVWIFPTAYLPRWLVSPIRRHDPSPPWQWPFVLAFTGVRGIVSLAAAFAIPFATATGAPFPDRDLILFLTFSVILVTLVGQGLLLPWVIRRLGLAHAGRREREFNRAEELKARAEAVQAASERLDQLAEERNLPVEVIEVVRAQHRDRLQHIEDRSADEGVIGKHSDLHEEVERLLIDAERTRINDLFRTGKLKDEVRRRIERELDLREAELPK